MGTASGIGTFRLPHRMTHGNVSLREIAYGDNTLETA
jgi:hypothetical protein